MMNYSNIFLNNEVSHRLKSEQSRRMLSDMAKRVIKYCNYNSAWSSYYWFLNFRMICNESKETIDFFNIKYNCTSDGTPFFRIPYVNGRMCIHLTSLNQFFPIVSSSLVIPSKRVAAISSFMGTPWMPNNCVTLSSLGFSW